MDDLAQSKLFGYKLGTYTFGGKGIAQVVLSVVFQAGWSWRGNVKFFTATQSAAWSTLWILLLSVVFSE